MENAQKVNNWRFKSDYKFSGIKKQYIAIVPLQALHQQETNVTGNTDYNVNGLSYKECVHYSVLRMHIFIWIIYIKKYNTNNLRPKKIRILNVCVLLLLLVQQDVVYMCLTDNLASSLAFA
jgi:hypothetical protein